MGKKSAKKIEKACKEANKELRHLLDKTTGTFPVNWSEKVKPEIVHKVADKHKIDREWLFRIITGT